MICLLLQRQNMAFCGLSSKHFPGLLCMISSQPLTQLCMLVSMCIPPTVQNGTSESQAVPVHTLPALILASLMPCSSQAMGVFLYFFASQTSLVLCSHSPFPMCSLEPWFHAHSSHRLGEYGHSEISLVNNGSFYYANMH